MTKKIVTTIKTKQKSLWIKYEHWIYHTYHLYGGHTFEKDCIICTLSDKSLKIWEREEIYGRNKNGEGFTTRTGHTAA